MPATHDPSEMAYPYDDDDDDDEDDDDGGGDAASAMLLMRLPDKGGDAISSV